MPPHAPLSHIQCEVLKEVGNIGAGHAATALSDLLAMPVGLTEPSVATIPLDRVNAPVEGRELAALHMSVLGEAPAEIIVLFDRLESIGFVRRFLTQTIGDIDVDEALVAATLREIANIVGGSYITALVGLIGLSLLPSTPNLIYGTLERVVSTVVGMQEAGLYGTEAFVIDNGFVSEGGSISVRFVLIPREDSLGPYLHAFGVDV